MKITSDNLVPYFQNGETQIVIQRHANYDKNTGEMLNLEDTAEIDYKFFKELFSTLNEEEKNNIYVLFLASNTKNKHSGIERAVESTNVAYKVATEIFNKFGVPKDHIINNQNFNGQIKKDLNLVEPKMFTDNTGYYEYLKGKYQDLSLEFWTAFEEDLEKYYRLQVFGEGPDEIVDRGLEFLTLIKRYSDYIHSVKPNSRLIVWSGTHYDLISPLIKQVVMNLDKKEYLPVDYNAGITITIDKNGRFITSVDGLLYDLGDINDIHINRNLR